VKKDCFAASKLKSCQMLADWIPSINNFVWFSFRNCEG
jgi:hypothetical protein